MRSDRNGFQSLVSGTTNNYFCSGNFSCINIMRYFIVIVCLTFVVVGVLGFFAVLLGIEPKTLYMLGKLSTTELYFILRHLFF